MPGVQRHRVRAVLQIQTARLLEPLPFPHAFAKRGPDARQASRAIDRPMERAAYSRQRLLRVYRAERPIGGAVPDTR